MAESSQPLSILEKNIRAMHERLADSASQDSWLSLQEDLVLLAETIKATINPETVVHFDQSELKTVRFIEESYRQMLVVIKDEMKRVSEELRKIKQRDSIQNAYQKL